MRLHYLQHVPFEGPAGIADWAEAGGHTVTGTALYDGAELPSLDDIHWLAVMGGPMSVHDEADHAWLAREKAFVKAAIDAGKVVVGVCLGAQLIAEVLGGSVTKAKNKEIGWFPVMTTPEAVDCELFKRFPGRYTAFHWHGEAFTIPPGAVRVARSEANPDQGFVWRDRVLGLQYHLETTEESLRALIDNCSGELDGGGDFVQSAPLMLENHGFVSILNFNLKRILDRLAELNA